MGNIVRVRVVVRGVRSLLQHSFGPETIPLGKEERTGVAGNNPEEWRKTCLVTESGELYLPGTYIFGCLKNGAFHTKRGRSSLQGPLVSTLQVEEDIVLLGRQLPDEKELVHQRILVPSDPSIKTFIYVSSVRNPTTKRRNVRYRLATRPGWECSFTLCWDKTVISREQMKAILLDSGTLGGLGDGIKIGCGRFAVASYEELGDAEETSAERSVGEYTANGVGAGR